MKRTAFVYITSLFCCSCGLVFQGRQQTVTVETTPLGRSVLLRGERLTTPATVQLDRTSSPLTIRGAEGSTCKLVIPYRNPLFVTLDSIPLALPLLVDLAAGSLGVFPDTIHLDLTLDAETEATAAPPDDAAILRAYNEMGADLCDPKPLGVSTSRDEDTEDGGGQGESGLLQDVIRRMT
jgi:hypothetical protein